MTTYSQYPKHNAIKRAVAAMGAPALFAGIQVRRIASGRDPLTISGFNRQAKSPHRQLTDGVVKVFYRDVMAVYTQYLDYYHTVTQPNIV